MKSILERMSYKKNGGQKVGAGEHIAVDLFKERQAGQVATAGRSGRDAGSHNEEEQCRTAGWGFGHRRNSTGRLDHVDFDLVQKFTFELRLS